MGTSLTDTGTAMDGSLRKSRSLGGALGKGIKGIGKRFGKLFRFFGKKRGLAGLIIGAGLGMASLLDTAKIGETVGTAFSKLTGVVSNFATSLKNVALKAAGATAKAVTKALASVATIGAKIIPKKIPTGGGRGAANAVEKAGDRAKYLKGLSGGGRGAANAVEKAGDRAKYLKGLSPNRSAAKLGAELSEAALKKSLLKTGFGVVGKAIPVAGAVLGLGLAAWRALKGDFVGATGEFAGVFAPSLVGLPLDLGLAARDIYYDQFGVYPEAEKDLSLAKSRMGQITAFLRKQKPKAEIQPSNSQSTPMQFGAVTSGNNRNLNLVPNMAYDYNSDGSVSMGERRKAGRAGLPDGPAFINAPVTNIVTTNKSEKSYFSKALTMQDPIISSAIGAH